jgi:hypothetical protein
VVIPEEPRSVTANGFAVAQVSTAVASAGAPPGTEPGVTEIARRNDEFGPLDQSTTDRDQAEV